MDCASENADHLISPPGSEWLFIDEATQCEPNEEPIQRTVSTGTCTETQPCQSLEVQTESAVDRSITIKDSSSQAHILDHTYPACFGLPAEPVQSTTHSASSPSTPTSSFAEISILSPSEDILDILTDVETVENSSDEDFVFSESEVASEASDDEGCGDNGERKFIVYERQLDKLLYICKTCNSLCDIEKSVTGSLVTVTTICPNNHISKWSSQPVIGELPEGNLLISAAILFSVETLGSTFIF